MKKAVLFSMAVCVCVLSTPVHAAVWGDYEYTDNGDGTCTITDYLGPGGDVTIPNTLNTLTVTIIGNWAFAYDTSLTSVVIPDYVVTIGDKTFYFCDNLTSVTIGSSVTSIGYQAFSYCRDLNTINLPEGVTNIGNMAFNMCWSLTNITIPNTVTSIGYGAFSSCGGLTVVTIGNSVTSIGLGAFSGCWSLPNIIIPKSVVDIGNGAFSGCSSLTAINVDELNSVYSSLNGVLFNKSQTTLLQYPGGTIGEYTIPDSVTSIGEGAFSSCTGLTDAFISNGVTSIEKNAFSGCTSLTSIILPDSLTSLGESVFERCISLTNILIPDSVTSIGSGAFMACNNLTEIIVASTNPSYSSIDGVLFNKDHTELVQYPGGKVGAYSIPDSVMTIAMQAFADCNLTSVTFPDSVTAIEDRAFYECYTLHCLYFKGDAPSLGSSVFSSWTITIYYLQGTTGWGPTYAGLPTAVWPLSVADVNTDGDVNLSDFYTFAGAWQTVDGVDDEYNPLCDISDPVDGVIDVNDLDVFAGQWLITPCP